MFEIDRQQANEYETIAESWEQLKDMMHAAAANAAKELEGFDHNAEYSPAQLQRMNYAAAVHALYMHAKATGMFGDDEAWH